MRELSIYIHIPFCVQKCRYCDFLSYPAPEQEKKEYLNLLLTEIEQQSFFYKEHQVISVFLGGGTPSLLGSEEIKAVFEKLKRNYTFGETPEITIEVNPGTVTADKLEAYLAAGINRLSIGLQTANDEELRTLGRIHDYGTFCRTYECARKLGFQNINVDLISAIPGQSVKSYRETLQKVLNLEPEHISAYSLILEEGTWFYEHKKELDFLSEEEDREIYELTGAVLSEYDYNRYEISNYAKSGYECRHNKVYWQRGDYAGFGLGAASMVEEARWNNARTMDGYRAALAHADKKPYTVSQFDNGPCTTSYTALQSNNNPHIVSQNELFHARARFAETIQALSKKEQMEEFMFLGLRLMQGVEKKAFEKKFGMPVETVYGDVLKKLQNDGLLIINDTIRLTPYGIDISCYVMSQFLFD